MLHICTERMQPATSWVDEHSGAPIRMGFDPEAMLWPGCCRAQRRAKDCVVQSYYDGVRVWCAPEKGCKDPEVIAAKKARAFANRSAGQKARWAKRSIP